MVKLAIVRVFLHHKVVAIKRALEPEIKREAEQRKEAGIPSSDSDAGRTDEKIGKFRRAALLCRVSESDDRDS
jgi:hypothetical protein